MHIVEVIKRGIYQISIVGTTLNELVVALQRGGDGMTVLEGLCKSMKQTSATLKVFVISCNVSLGKSLVDKGSFMFLVEYFLERNLTRLMILTASSNKRYGYFSLEILKQECSQPHHLLIHVNRATKWTHVASKIIAKLNGKVTVEETFGTCRVQSEFLTSEWPEFVKQRDNYLTPFEYQSFTDSPPEEACNRLSTLIENHGFIANVSIGYMKLDYQLDFTTHTLKVDVYGESPDEQLEPAGESAAAATIINNIIMTLVKSFPLLHHCILRSNVLPCKCFAEIIDLHGCTLETLTVALNKPIELVVLQLPCIKHIGVVNAVITAPISAAWTQQVSSLEFPSINLSENLAIAFLQCPNLTKLTVAGIDESALSYVPAIYSKLTENFMMFFPVCSFKRSGCQGAVVLD